MTRLFMPMFQSLIGVRLLDVIEDHTVMLIVDAELFALLSLFKVFATF